MIITIFGFNQLFTQPHCCDRIEDRKAGPVNEFGERTISLAGIKTKKAASMFGDVRSDNRNCITVAFGNHGADQMTTAERSAQGKCLDPVVAKDAQTLGMRQLL